MRAVLVAGSVVLLVAGCSTLDTGAPAPTADGSGGPPGVAPSSVPAPPGTPFAAPPGGPAAGRLAPPKIPGIAWQARGSAVDGRPATYVAEAGPSVGLLWIDPTLVTFRLVPGVKVPEGGPALPEDNQPQTWVPRMVAAFNGGFLLKDGVGGYYDAGRVVAPLVPGFAALAITRDGRAQVGRWGRDLGLTSATVTVRQNLPLLVDHFRAMTSPRDSARTWGLANGDLWTANRSAVGERPDGALVYAYGHEVRAQAMADALVRVGVERAMVLDMNKSWPGGFVYWHTSTGVHGLPVQPLEYHAPSVYFARYTKDFVVVLAR
jgi:hypothetical protein